MPQMPRSHFTIPSNESESIKYPKYKLKMSFDFTGKVAFVTGAASGIGLGYTKSLLKNGVKGVAIVDINSENGTKAQKELGEKTIFLKTDVTKKEELEASIKETIKKFGHLDIVINNAGAVCEDKWELELSLNVNAVVQGVLFGFQYMRKDKGGRGGVILNTASVAGLLAVPTFPVYAGSKAFVINFGRSMGTDIYYNDTRVKVLTLCPGKVDTHILNMLSYLKDFDNLPNVQQISESFEMQTPEHLGDSMIEIIKRGENGSCWIVTDNKPIYEYKSSQEFLLNS